jgi:ABC-type amino acid transport substrate-binding protein
LQTTLSHGCDSLDHQTLESFSVKNGFLILIAVLISVALNWCLFGRSGEGMSNGKKETAFEHILRTRTIRCGYYIYPPVTYKDPNTGKLSGLSVDMIERIAKRADLKVEWVQEVNFGDWQLGLQAKRYDLACTPMWPNTAIGQVVYFTRPFFYAGIYPIGRSGETRFRTLADINQAGVTLSAQEGSENFYLSKELFPQAKMTSVAPNADGNLIAQNVMNHKADVLLSDKNLVNEINNTNPNALKILVQQPVKMMPFTLAVSVGEDSFLQFINNATDEMLLTGEIDRLLKKWVADPNIYQTVPPVWNDELTQ